MIKNFKFNILYKSLGKSSFSTHQWGISKEEDIKVFRQQANIALDLACSHFLKVNEGRVLPECKPNFLKSLIDNKPNAKPVDFENTINELNNSILSNFTKMDHQGYLSWFPCMPSYQGIVGNLLNHSFINPSTSYENSKAIFELEKKITDWFKDAYGLDKIFNSKQSGSLIYHGVSLTSICATFAAKRRALSKYPDDLNKFKYYCSEQSHYSIKKAINLAGSKATIIPIHFCKDKNNFIMNIEVLKETIAKDVSNGYIPIYVAATLGTTGTTAIDSLEEIGDIASKYNMWYHVDGAYAANALILEEYRWILKGVEKADSFGFNPVKLFPVLQNSACCYFKNISEAVRGYEVDNIVNDYQSGLNLNDVEFITGRVNKCFKMYASLSSYGKVYLQDIARRIFSAAREAEKVLSESGKFEVMFQPCNFGLVCFKLKTRGNNDLMKFITLVNDKGKLFIGPMDVKFEDKEELIIVRLSINWLYTTDEVIRENMNDLILAYKELFNND